MYREFAYLSALSENNIDSTFIRQGYHEAPDVLRRQLQAEIDAVESGLDPRTNQVIGENLSASPNFTSDFDAILIGYGLCSNGIVGIHSKKYPLVIPRGHDCITFFLGSKERYMEYFKKMPGCFWYTMSWIENAGSMPCEESNRRQLEYYRAKGYDEDDLAFFMDEITGWTKKYKCAAYIKMPFFDKEESQQFTKKAADFYHWQYKQIDGDMGLMKRFLDGDWNAEEFLVVPPRHRVIATNDAQIISYEDNFVESNT